MGRVKVFFRPMATIQNDCRLWAQSIADSYHPDLVVFLAKSGFLFAQPMAEEFGCPMVDIAVSRPDNGAKDAIREKTPWAPKWLLALALSSKAGYMKHERDGEREMQAGKRLENLALSDFKNILIVDDSVDTGWSMLRVQKYLAEVAPESDIRIASYCVIDMSKERVHVDYSRFHNTIAMTATSRFSPEHDGFLRAYEEWLSRA